MQELTFSTEIRSDGNRINYSLERKAKLLRLAPQQEANGEAERATEGPTDRLQKQSFSNGFGGSLLRCGMKPGGDKEP